MIVPKHYENLHVLHENTMPDRAYYIPASRRMGPLVENREVSDRFQLLNGEWKFCYYSSIADLKEPFFHMPPQTEGYETLPVPGCWQNAGYDLHQYTNIRYPFPVDPPYVPLDNPCGTYLHTFDYRKDEKAPRAYLEFEGVDSCFFAWLNGSYVGYSQVSHALSEFDVTDLIREGPNVLAILVLKWCDGSYLEDQDKFRMSGIFRDVYLLKRPEHFLWDYFIRTKLSEGSAAVSIHPTFLDRSIPVRATVYDAGETEIARFMFQEDAAFTIRNPVLWNSEQPYLYTLVMETENEVITERIGLREISIKNSVVYLNGNPIKFRGVNRHDSDPVTGPVISVEHMKRDLTMIRQNNFNAIRTSHYPNAPMFYQMCDEYGFFVIDEADNESHGPWMHCYANDTDEERAARWNEMISDNPEFEEATLDRVRKLVTRDKNRPCVLVWSMGNECGYGCTFEKALEWTKAYDPDRLTHYESAYYRGRKRKYDYSNIDLYSRMYPPFEQVLDYVRSAPDKPFLMCEYCHSMGNGAGDYEDYFRLIDQHDCICGGFVWEWCDHAIDKGRSEDGRTIYYYGGDHGEYPHDGNFCMDGLVAPDRTPHPGLLEYKNVHRPARVLSYDQKNGMLTLKNEMNFVDLKEYLDIRYEVTCDGTVTASGTIEQSGIRPHQTGSVALSVPVPEKGRVYLRILYALKREEPFRARGYDLGFDEIRLQNEDGANQIVAELTQRRKREAAQKPGIRLEENEDQVLMTGDGFSYTYDKRYGRFDSLKLRDKELLNRPMGLNIWRAPTDNDIALKQEWYKAMYDKAVQRSYATHTSRTDTGVEIFSRLSLSAVSLQRMMTIDAAWSVTNGGQISAKLTVRKDMDFPELPRFGLRLFLPETMNRVAYYGLGPGEAYADMCQAARHGLFSASVQDMHEDFIRPQENGSRCGCDFVTVFGNRVKLTAYSSNPFSFQASVYSQEELTQKAHNYELVPSGSTILCLDYKQNGIGSNSCGPRLSEQYRFDEEAFTFEICLAPEPDENA